MNRKLIAALFALAFGLSATTLAVAEETAKSEQVKAPMYAAKCQAPCNFSVKSHDKAEVVSILKEHAKTHHDGMILSDEQAEGMVKTVEPK
jgi:predicted small metal-binding protein